MGGNSSWNMTSYSPLKITLDVMCYVENIGREGFGVEAGDPSE